MAKVLVVDDRPFMLRYIEHVVARAGHKPIKARNSVEVAEALSKDQPAVVVMDICPGEMESVRKALSGATFARMIPIIVMTGLPNQPLSSKTNANVLQPAVVFNRPFSPSELVGTIEQLLKEAA